MFRLLAFAAGLCIATCFDGQIILDDAGNDGLSLLQMKAHKANATGASAVEGSPYANGLWRHGGCRTQLGEIATCGWDSDMHMRGRFNAPWEPDFHQVGLVAGASTTDNSVTMQVFQCPWNAGNAASTAGIALQMGDHLFEFLRDPSCQENIYVKLDGELLDQGSLPRTLDDGLFIEGGNRDSGMCIDSADGRSSAAVRYRMNNRNNCDNMRMQAWYDLDLKIPADVAVTGDESACGDTSWTGTVRKIDLAAQESMFSQASHDHLCQHCEWGGRGPCERPPPVPPPPPSQQSCEEKGCSYETAQQLCSSLQSHDTAFEDCLTDICASCGDGNDPMAIAENDIENEEAMEPGPCCVDASNECGLPSATCSNAVKMNIFNQVTNNLGGMGPDDGAEEIRFGNAAAVNGQVLDLVIKQTGGHYKTKKPSANGKHGVFGVINLKHNQDIDLEFSFQDASSGENVVLETVAITFYDIDEGKKGQSRTTLTACGAENALITTNTELTVKTIANCFAVSSSVHGTASDNPTSPSSLTAVQAARTATFVFNNVGTASVNYAIAKGFGARNVFFLVEPTVACFEGYDPDLPCGAGSED